MKMENFNESPQLFSKESIKSTKTTIPFIKNNEFDYANLLRFLGDGYEKWAFLIYIPIIIFIITFSIEISLFLSNKSYPIFTPL